MMRIAQGAAVITGPDDVTAAVLAEVERAKEPRTRELLAAAVRHLHAFVRETHLTEAESGAAWSVAVDADREGSRGDYGPR